MLPSRWNTPPATRWGKVAVFLPALLWYALICFFSSQTGSESSQLSNLVVEESIGWMGDWGAIFRVDWDALQFLSFLIRKAAHMGVFFILTGLLLFALWRLGASPGPRPGSPWGCAPLWRGWTSSTRPSSPAGTASCPTCSSTWAAGCAFSCCGW